MLLSGGSLAETSFGLFYRVQWGAKEPVMVSASRAIFANEDEGVASVGVVALHGLIFILLVELRLRRKLRAGSCEETAVFVKLRSSAVPVLFSLCACEPRCSSAISSHHGGDRLGWLMGRGGILGP